LASDPIALRQPLEKGAVEAAMGAEINVLGCGDLAQSDEPQPRL
jgi:hypothetical protein